MKEITKGAPPTAQQSPIHKFRVAKKRMSARQERQRLKTLQKKFSSGKLNNKSELIQLAVSHSKV